MKQLPIETSITILKVDIDTFKSTMSIIARRLLEGRPVSSELAGILNKVSSAVKSGTLGRSRLNVLLDLELLKEDGNLKSLGDVRVSVSAKRVIEYWLDSEAVYTTEIQSAYNNLQSMSNSGRLGQASKDALDEAGVRLERGFNLQRSDGVRAAVSVSTKVIIDFFTKGEVSQGRDIFHLMGMLRHGLKAGTVGDSSLEALEEAGLVREGQWVAGRELLMDQAVSPKENAIRHIRLYAARYHCSEGSVGEILLELGRLVNVAISTSSGDLRLELLKECSERGVLGTDGSLLEVVREKRSYPGSASVLLGQYATWVRVSNRRAAVEPDSSVKGKLPKELDGLTARVASLKKSGSVSYEALKTEGYPDGLDVDFDIDYLAILRGKAMYVLSSREVSFLKSAATHRKQQLAGKGSKGVWAERQTEQMLEGKLSVSRVDYHQAVGNLRDWGLVATGSFVDCKGIKHPHIIREGGGS